MEWEVFTKKQWICILLEEHVWFHDYVFKPLDIWWSKIKQNNLEHVEINTVTQFIQLNMDPEYATVTQVANAQRNKVDMFPSSGCLPQCLRCLYTYFINSLSCHVKCQWYIIHDTELGSITWHLRGKGQHTRATLTGLRGGPVQLMKFSKA